MDLEPMLFEARDSKEDFNFVSMPQPQKCMHMLAVDVKPILTLELAENRIF